MMNSKAPKQGIWRVGELAAASGVSTDTLRHYERKGLLQPMRSSNGYREYPAHALERVQMVRRALAIGFTLDELSAVFRVFDRGGAPCHEVRSLAAVKLAEIERHLSEVVAMRDELRECLKDWDERLAKAARGQRVGLLRALADRDSVPRSSTGLFLRTPKQKQKGRKK